MSNNSNNILWKYPKIYLKRNDEKINQIKKNLSELDNSIDFNKYQYVIYLRENPNIFTIEKFNDNIPLFEIKFNNINIIDVFTLHFFHNEEKTKFLIERNFLI